jgi:hypothetical protein
VGVGVDIRQEEIGSRIDKTLLEMIALAKQAGPGQIEVPEPMFNKWYHLLGEIQEIGVTDPR